VALTKYLLPCECGEKIPIEPRQAGETILCVCGTTMRAPAMLDMTKLEVAIAEESRPLAPTAWGVRHGLVLAGLAVAASAIALLIVIVAKRPEPPDPPPTPEQIREEVGQWSPLESWKRFRAAKATGLDPAPRKDVSEYAEQVTRYKMRLAAAAIAILLGMALIVVPLVAPRRPGPHGS
jgi:hypothetical protein